MVPTYLCLQPFASSILSLETQSYFLMVLHHSIIFPEAGEIRIYHTFASFKAGSVEGGSKKLEALLIFKPG